MKSILIISALDIWSMGDKKGAQSLWYTLKGFAERGWQVFFLTSNEGESIKRPFWDNIEVIRMNNSLFRKLSTLKKIGFFFRPFRWLSFQLRMFPLASKIAKKNKIDLFYGYEIYGAPVAKLLGIRFKKKVISKFQGTILKPKMQNKFWKIKHWHHYIGLKTPSDLIIMANDGTEGNKVLKTLNVDMEKVKFWMNGIDKNVYRSDFDMIAFKKELGIDSKTKILLTVSRLEHWKRVDRILKAMPDITKQNSDVRLFILGDGSERTNLEKLVEKLSLEKYVIFVGSISHDKVADFLNAADIFISLYDLSNVGNSLLEAMICSKCIVTLNNGDTGDYIKNNQNGVLLNMEDLKSLPAIIIDLLSNDKKRMALGKKAGEFAVDNFWSWKDRMDIEVETVENLFK